MNGNSDVNSLLVIERDISTVCVIECRMIDKGKVPVGN
jgi:hypothetical protein